MTQEHLEWARKVEALRCTPQFLLIAREAANRISKAIVDGRLEEAHSLCGAMATAIQESKSKCRKRQA